MTGSATEAGRRAPSLQATLGAAVVAVGFAVGIERLHDNSFLTHLATGRLIRSTGIPRVDPYTFTAGGEPWVVQSWLPSWVYAALDATWSLDAVRLLTGVLCATILGCIWLLSRPATSLVLRLALVATASTAMIGFLAERPLLVGLVGVAVALLVAEGQLDPRWLVPVGWVWVNSHGSFPLGLVVLGVLWAGGMVDRTDVRHERRALIWLSVGVLLGAVNPLGPRLLWFPIELLGRSSVLRDNIVEWMPVDLGTGPQVAFAILAVVALGVVARRWSWRAALAVAVFVPAAALSRRNVPVAVLVLTPLVAARLPVLGTLTGAERPRPTRIAAAALLALTASYAVVALQRPATAFVAYPVDLVTYLEEEGQVGPGSSARLVAPDYVGNYLSARYGRDARSFIDDRYDLFPLELIEDYDVLVEAGDAEAVRFVLDRHDADLVLWRKDEGLHQVLSAEPGWSAGPASDPWVVHCRDASDAAAVCAGEPADG